MPFFLDCVVWGRVRVTASHLGSFIRSLVEFISYILILWPWIVKFACFRCDTVISLVM